MRDFDPANDRLGSKPRLVFNAHMPASVWSGLYVEGKNVTVEFRWAEGRVDHVPTLAAEGPFVLLRVN